MRHRTLRPFEPPPGRTPPRPLFGAVHGQKAGHAFHHHFARFVLRLPDERDPRLGVVNGNAAHPFGAGARLTGAAASEDEPRRPRAAVFGAFGRALMRMSEARKIEFECVGLKSLKR